MIQQTIDELRELKSRMSVAYGNEMSEQRMNDIYTLDKAIIACEQLRKYRKKAKRWKRKYLALKGGCASDSDTIAYNDDFATALEKISKYEDKMKREKAREKAIETLNKYSPTTKEFYDCTTAEVLIAIGMAISALKQEKERMFSEDAKSTKEVMRILTLLMSEAGKDGKLILSDAKAMIYDLPSVYQKTECEDAVGRQASFNTIESMYQKCDGDLQTYHDLLVDCFEVLPSVQPKAKTGRWIKDGDKLKCPICGAKGENIKDDYCYNFCPVCGARMVDE